MTEPDCGTDLGNMKTGNASVKNDRVVLNGAKTMISRAEEADLFVIFTRVNDAPGTKGIGCVFVEKELPGLTQTHVTTRWAARNLADVRFENVEVPIENLGLGEGSLRKLLGAFNTQRCLNPAICLGMAESSLEESIRFYEGQESIRKFDWGLSRYEMEGSKHAYRNRDEQIHSLQGSSNSGTLPLPNATLAAMAKIYVNEMSIKFVVKVFSSMEDTVSLMTLPYQRKLSWCAIWNTRWWHYRNTA